MCTVFIFVSREEKDFYRIVSLGQKILTADHTAGSAAVCKVTFCIKKIVYKKKKYTSVNSFNHGLALTASKQLVPDNITIIP